MNEFERRVTDGLARIEQWMKDHPAAHETVDRRLGALEAENIHRNRVSMLVSSITAAVVSATGHIFMGWKQSP